MSRLRKIKRHLKPTQGLFMFKLEICEPLVVNKIAYSFQKYLEEVIASLPYWRTREGSLYYDDLFALIEDTSSTPVITDTFHEKLAVQMELSSQGLGQINPALARPTIRYARVVYEAKKLAKDEYQLKKQAPPEPAPVEPTPAEAGE